MIRKEAIITGAMLMLITYTLGLSLVSQAFPAGQTTRTFSSSGTIQIQTPPESGISVYSDSGCTSPLTSLTWGTLQPGGSQDVICYIKNEGDTALTLSLQTSNWQPTSPVAAQDYLSLGWNYDNQPLSPDQVVPITLTLSVASNIHDITTFGFDVTIVSS